MASRNGSSAPRSARQRQRRVSARATGLTPLLEKWLQQAAKHLADREINRLRRRKLLAKDNRAAALRRRLADILGAWGLRQAESAAADAAGEDVEVPRSIQAGLIKEATHQAGLIYAQTSESATASVNRIIRDALSEEPRPSPARVARRIRNQFHGDGGGSIQGRVDQRTYPGASTKYSTDRGTIYALSSERAATIARTELGRAEAIGQDAGYRAVGVWGYEWIAYSDGRSGDRHHERMDGKRVKLGTKFRLPNGERAAYPQAPGMSARNAINCRCDFKAITKPPKGKS